MHLKFPPPLLLLLLLPPQHIELAYCHFRFSGRWTCQGGVGGGCWGEVRWCPLHSFCIHRLSSHLVESKHCYKKNIRLARAQDNMSWALLALLLLWLGAKMGLPLRRWSCLWYIIWWFRGIVLFPAATSTRYSWTSDSQDWSRQREKK